jgi:hypothetical protein
VTDRKLTHFNVGEIQLAAKAAAEGALALTAAELANLRTPQLITFAGT